MRNIFSLRVWTLANELPTSAEINTPMLQAPCRDDKNFLPISFSMTTA